jgi:hypothetical protein
LTVIMASRAACVPVSPAVCSAIASREREREIARQIVMGRITGERASRRAKDMCKERQRARKAAREFEGGKGARGKRGTCQSGRERGKEVWFKVWATR